MGCDFKNSEHAYKNLGKAPPSGVPGLRIKLKVIFESVMHCLPHPKVAESI
jgi:hypothetical protein